MKHLSLLLACLLALQATAQTERTFNPDTLATSVDDPLAGLVMDVIGDSYVANHQRPQQETWHAQVAARHGMKYRNHGRNGGCVAFDRAREGFGPSMMVRHKDLDPEADLVLIIAGHNDAVKVGCSKDSLRMFTDSLTHLLADIRVQCPKARIAYVTPWYVDRPGFKPVVKAIRKVCRRAKVPLLDNYSANSVIQVRDDDFRRLYFQRPNDTAHLNAAGHQLYLPTGEAFIMHVMGME